MQGDPYCRPYLEAWLKSRRPVEEDRRAGSVAGVALARHQVRWAHVEVEVAAVVLRCIRPDILSRRVSRAVCAEEMCAPTNG
jgi:hypothetical protein